MYIYTQRPFHCWPSASHCWNLTRALYRWEIRFWLRHVRIRPLSCANSTPMDKQILLLFAPYPSQHMSCLHIQRLGPSLPHINKGDSYQSEWATLTEVSWAPRPHNSTLHFLLDQNLSTSTRSHITHLSPSLKQNGLGTRTTAKGKGTHSLSGAVIKTIKHLVQALMTHRVHERLTVTQYVVSNQPM